MPSLHLELKTVFSVFPLTDQFQFYCFCLRDLIPNSSKSDQMVVVAVGASCVLRYAGICLLYTSLLFYF